MSTPWTSTNGIDPNAGRVNFPTLPPGLPPSVYKAFSDFKNALGESLKDVQRNFQRMRQAYDNDELKGATGATGATGAAGTNGTNGTNGTPGAAGAKGDKGDKGDPGTPGMDGVSPCDSAPSTGNYVFVSQGGECSWLEWGTDCPDPG